MAIESTLVFLAVLIFGMNVVPAFMPPTWIVLAFFYMQFRLPLLAVVAVGAIAATLGRIVLAHIARHHVRRFLAKRHKKNYDALGTYFRTHTRITIPLLFLYAFFPLPSNQVYIIAGLAKANIKIIAASFFVGRLFSYTFWVATTHHLSRQLSDIFATHLQNGVLIGEFVGIGLIFFVGRINWHKILKNHFRR